MKKWIKEENLRRDWSGNHLCYIWYLFLCCPQRSSRSIAANIAEAWKKRIYPKMFVSKIIDAAGEAGETEVWLDIAGDTGYISVEKHKEMTDGYDEVNRMLYGMIEKPEKFCPKSIKST